MVLIICTKNELNLTKRYWDMVPDRQKERTDGQNGRTDGRRQNYIPLTSSRDNKLKGASFIFSMTNITILSIFCTHAQKEYCKVSKMKDAYILSILALLLFKNLQMIY